MAGSTTPSHLDPSALGTKEYWDSLYEKELSNHADNPTDEGTVWFDDADAENKIVQFLDEYEQISPLSPSSPSSSSSPLSSEGCSGERRLDRATAAVLDLGCGNGSLLFALRDDGWAGRLLGVDYSERSVELARAVAVSRGVAAVSPDDESQHGGGGGEDQGLKGRVEFKVWDVVGGSFDNVRAAQPGTEPDEERQGAAGWDLVLDKGTFDAISLSAERDAQGRRICEGYGGRVLQLLRMSGIFLVTSCNWTEKELREWFETEKSGREDAGAESGEARLRLAGRVEYPSFSFGGVKGQTISTLCFQKVAA